MYKLLLVSGLILIAVTGKAQIIIQGRVLDNNSGLPVANASVYLNNTSYGTITTITGEFSMNVSSIFTGDLIVSSVGYQQLSYHLNSKDNEKKFYIFRLDIKEKNLKNILIINDATRQQWMKIFKENFLGVTEEAEHCSIENLQSVYFAMGKNKNTIYAYADTALILINKFLGYKIYFDLIEFSLDKENGSNYFFGYSRFEEMGDKKRWIKRRRENYFGSTMHFYRSLIADDLPKEGFSIFEIKDAKLTSSDSVDKKVTKILPGTAAMALPITAGKILFADSISGNYMLKSPDKIMVRYNKRNPVQIYLARKVFLQNAGHSGFTSYIKLLSEKVELDKNAIVMDPLAIVYYGFWVYEKMANQLPFNYQPD